MNTLLDYWQSKKSWQNTMPFCTIYKSKDSGEKDISLKSLLSKEKKLTFNPKAPVGFNEIDIVPISDEIPEDRKYLTEPLTKNSNSLNENAKELLSALKIFLKHVWDSSKFHLVTCSAGMDSRILAWTLSQLRDEMGEEWLGDIHFRCHEPEGPLFKQAMALMKWKKDQYSVYKENAIGKPDYYNTGDFSVDSNAFFRPTIQFYDDIVKSKDEKNTILINGLCGGEIFSYPLFKQRASSENRYLDLVSNTVAIRTNFSKIYNKWHDVLMPFISYLYLDTAFRVPSHEMYWIQNKHKQERDSVRSKMMTHFPDNVPFFIGHSYNLVISKKRIEYMKKSYRSSKFFRDFKAHSLVKNAKAWEIYKNRDNRQLFNRGQIDLKLYGLATVYENVTR